jgi:hypothetical protein
VLDLETVFCFLVHHEMRLGPRNTTILPVDFLSLVHPVQSASKNALTIVDEDGRMRKPESSVYLRK